MTSSNGTLAQQMNAVLDRDHAHLLERLADTQYLMTKGSFQIAAKVFAEFRRLHEQHLLREEALMLEVGQRVGFPRELAGRALAEHRVLRAQLESTWNALTCRDRVAFDREIELLTAAIDAHERGEKEDLLPALAAALGDAQGLKSAVHKLIDRSEDHGP